MTDTITFTVRKMPIQTHRLIKHLAKAHKIRQSHLIHKAVLMLAKNYTEQHSLDQPCNQPIPQPNQTSDGQNISDFTLPEALATFQSESQTKKLKMSDKSKLKARFNHSSLSKEQKIKAYRAAMSGLSRS